jgi:hypothetical protein
VKRAFLPFRRPHDRYDADAHAATSWTLGIGKISSATLSVGNQGPIDQAVTGPQPKTKDKVELWVYLRS